MRRALIHATAWLLIAAIAATGLSVVAQTTQQATPPTNVPLIGKTAPPELILLYTGNVVGYIEPCG